MAYDYDKLYGETPEALGPPTKVIVDFFDSFDRKGARVLDVGCGQGRDAVFIARRGYAVTGVDISPNGIRDLNAIAIKDNLPIEGLVADIRAFEPSGAFDVILIDRTLHMLARGERLSVLRTFLDHVAESGWLLIADEASNIDEFQTVVSETSKKWTTKLRKRGYLFVRRI